MYVSNFIFLILKYLKNKNNFWDFDLCQILFAANEKTPPHNNETLSEATAFTAEHVLYQTWLTDVHILVNLIALAYFQLLRSPRFLPESMADSQPLLKNRQELPDSSRKAPRVISLDVFRGLSVFVSSLFDLWISIHYIRCVHLFVWPGFHMLLELFCMHNRLVCAFWFGCVWLSERMCLLLIW